MKVIDLTNCQFGRLAVIKRVDNDKYGNTVWQCRCECGNIVNVPANALKSGNTKSCGCLHKEITQINMSKTNIYDLSGEYGIGYTTNTNAMFKFDLEDFDLIKRYCWIESDQGYIIASVYKFTGENKNIRLHRLVTNFNYDNIDHINCDKKDNRKNNLRPITKQLNNINRQANSNNKLGIKGVFQLKNGNYMAKIQQGNKTFTKTNKDINVVIAWRQKKETELYGEYAYGGLNV